MTTYGYARVSTAEQAEGTSLGEQERVIRGMAQTEGLEPVVMLVDQDVSGALPLFERPKGEQLRGLVRGDSVLVAKLDRFSRNAADALARIDEWDAAGVRLVIRGLGIVTGPGSKNSHGRLLLEILAVFAGHERRAIKERQKEGQGAKRQQGGYLGGRAPFGWRAEGRGKAATLVPDPEAQRAIVYVMQARQEGRTLRAIAAHVFETFNLTITPNTVRRIAHDNSHPGLADACDGAGRSPAGRQAH